MQFNDTTNNQGILQDIDFFCGTNSATFSIPDKTRSINIWQDKIVTEVLDSMDDWDFQAEIATANLSANQQEYTFPSDILKIKRVELDLDGDGEYIPADPIDINQFPTYSVALSAQINAKFSESNPKFATFDDSFFVFPVPDANVTNGVKIWYEKNIATFTAMSTGWPSGTVGNSGSPDFPRPFHRILSLGPTRDYAQRKRINELIKFTERELFGEVQTRKGRKGGLMTALRDFYSTRSGDKKLKFSSHYSRENYK